MRKKNLHLKSFIYLLNLLIYHNDIIMDILNCSNNIYIQFFFWLIHMLHHLRESYQFFKLRILLIKKLKY